MRFVYEGLGLNFFMEDGISNIVLEKMSDFREIIQAIHDNENGITNNIIITDKDKEVKWDKKVRAIINPLFVEINDKKILNALLEDMRDIANQENVEDIATINQRIISLLDSVCEKLPYPIDFDCGMNLIDLFKIFSVGLDSTNQDFCERFIQYLKLSHQILGISFFITINLFDYFDYEEVLEIEKMLRYEHIILMNIESTQKNIKTGKWWIIDKDKCIISFEN